MHRNALLLTLACLAQSAAANDPLSAIDWLADRPAPVAQPAPVRKPIDEPAAVGDATAPSIEVIPLDAPSATGVGLLPTRVTGFPVSLWARSDPQTLSDLMGALGAQHPLPAVQSLLLSLLLAEADPPEGDTGGFLAARLEALIARGAVGPAEEMLALTGELTPELAPFAAKLALLRGETSGFCEDLAARPTLSADVSLRVYCLAQAGAWESAVTTLEAGVALGDVRPDQHNRLLRFLDPELAEELPALPPPRASDITPLDYRLLVAAGEPLPTTRLALAYAQADLSGDAGWRAKLEAAERLVRAGAIGEAQLFAAYGEQVPAASGGIWDRAEAVQQFDIALRARDPGAVSTRLMAVWPHMVREGLAVSFAKHYGEALSGLPLSDEARAAAWGASILSPDYERAAAKMTAETPLERFAQGLAAGAPEDAPTDQARAIAEAWGAFPPPDAIRRAIDEGRIGEAALRAAQLLSIGAEGDRRSLTEGLASLRALGLEDPARRAALQVLFSGDTRR